MNFERFIELNYNKLFKIASDLYKRFNLDVPEVLNEMYIDVQRRTNIGSTEEDYLKYCVKWLKNNRFYTGSNPIKKLYIKDVLLDDLTKYENILEKVSEPVEEEIKDLLSAGFSKEESLKIMKCVKASKKLPLYNYRLFQLYYIEGYTLQEIADSCELPKVSIFRDKEKMNKELIKIINKYE